MLKGIISAVDIHQQAIKLVFLSYDIHICIKYICLIKYFDLDSLSRVLESNIEIMLFCLILNVVISLSLNLFRVSFKLWFFIFIIFKQYLISRDMIASRNSKASHIFMYTYWIVESTLITIESTEFLIRIFLVNNLGLSYIKKVSLFSL